MSRFFALCAILLISVFASCNPYKELLPGYRMYDAPNAIDKPGRIYRLSENKKTDFLVSYLQVQPTPSPIFIKEREQTKTMNIKTVLSFLSEGKEAIDADVNAQFNKNEEFSFKLSDALVYKISDDDIRKIYPDLRKKLLEDIEIFGLKNPEYFIVREAVSAKSIYIKMSSKLSANADIKANINKLIGANGNVSWSNQTKDEIKVTLNEGLFVFYKPDKINLSHSIQGDVELSFKPVDSKSYEMLSIGK